MKVCGTIILALFHSFLANGQGLVVFNNSISGFVVTHVYQGFLPRSGNGSNDTPAGTTDWSSYPLVAGSGFMAAIRAAPGSGVSENLLTFGSNPTVTTFRTGAAAGRFASTTATLNQVPRDAPSATLQIFAWDRASTGITDPQTALQGWYNGAVPGGLSPTFSIQAVGGDINTPAMMIGLVSFSINVPEPSTVSFGGLGLLLWLAHRFKSRLRDK